MDGAAEAISAAKRVLLIEDSSVTKDLVELVLGQAGHSVTSAETGTDALAALLSEFVHYVDARLAR